MERCTLVHLSLILVCISSFTAPSEVTPAAANDRKKTSPRHDNSHNRNATLNTVVKKQNCKIVYNKNVGDKEAQKERELMAEISKLAPKKPRNKSGKATKQRPGSEGPRKGPETRPEGPEHPEAGFYTPSWRSLDRRPIPTWYEDAKFGIFVHWGVYSVPSFGSEWFWYDWKEVKQQKYVSFMDSTYPPGFSYAEFGPKFKAELFDADQWASLVARSGARYFVFTSKHHEGFANWNTTTAWNWNSVDTGPHIDIVGKLARAIRAVGLRFGLYYSLYEWFNPLYTFDKNNGFLTDEYVRTVLDPQLYELVTIYKPDILWSDGDWEANDTYWRSREFLAWLYNDSPVRDSVVVNDRWGRGCWCRHGGFHSCADRYNPGSLQEHKWENALTIDRYSWGHRREANIGDFLCIEELIKELVTTVSNGGNMLLNVGPAADGSITPIFQERLLQIGDWLLVNGDAIYGSRPWRAQNDSISSDVWYTSKAGVVYAIFLKWPSSWQGGLDLGEPIPTRDTQVSLLGLGRTIKWKAATFEDQEDGIFVELPRLTVSELPCKWAWVLRLTNVR